MKEQKSFQKLQRKVHFSGTGTQPLLAHKALALGTSGNLAAGTSGRPHRVWLGMTFGQQRPLHHIKTEGLPVPMAEVSQLLLLTQSDDYLEAGGPKRNSD